MARYLHPLLMLIARATDSQLGRYVEFLIAENRILRDRLPKKIDTTERERAQLLKLGLRVGPAIKELISIVTPRTFARWASGYTRKNTRRGRPRKPEEIRQLAVKIAKENNWGNKRVRGELFKLGIRISVSTVRRILIAEGIEPGPKRGTGSWHDFVQRHMKTLWACDFFTTRVWTLRGPVDYYVLFFIHLGTRRVHIAGMTPHPNGKWMAKVAVSLRRFFKQQGEHFPTHIIRDRDTKFTAEFCDKLSAAGIKFRTTSRRSPNMNPYAENWVQSLRRECLHHFIVLGETHLKYLLDEYVEHFNSERPHQGRGDLTPSETEPAEEPATISVANVECRTRLGGLLKHYVRNVA